MEWCTRPETSGPTSALTPASVLMTWLASTGVLRGIYATCLFIIQYRCTERYKPYFFTLINAPGLTTKTIFWGPLCTQKNYLTPFWPIQACFQEFFKRKMKKYRSIGIFFWLRKKWDVCLLGQGHLLG